MSLWPKSRDRTTEQRGENWENNQLGLRFFPFLKIREKYQV